MSEQDSNGDCAVTGFEFIVSVAIMILYGEKETITRRSY